VTLVELRYLVAVAEAGSFRRAAEAVHVSQPALSLAIQRLEEELGVTLFERGRTRVEPTAIGAAVVAQARRVLAEARVVGEIASRGKDPLAGAFRLGAIHTAGPYLLPVLNALARARLPGMTLSVEDDLTAALQARLERGELDAILVALPFDAAGTETEALYDEPFDVILPRGHPLAKRRSVDPAALATAQVLLLHSGHCFSNQVAGACPGAAANARILESNSLETLRHLVACGEGISVLPRSAAQSPATTALLAVRPFRAPAPSRRMALAWRRSYARPAAVAAVAALIREARPEGLLTMR
jgi:LysR family hydrogen peroxide-inducible transcriptional activator